MTGARREWPFDRPAEPPRTPVDTGDGVSTATALAWFRDELTTAGFSPDDVTKLVLVAAEAEVRKAGLAVTQPDTTAARQP